MSVPFLLAPMAELSHRALRELIEDFGGCNEYFTEMISAGALISGGPFEAYYIDAGPCPDRVVYQLAGADPGHIAAAAALLDRRDCAGIDINMGCSAPAIVRLGAGVRWMADPDKAAALIRRVRPHTRKRLSVKIRLGMEADLDYLVKFCRGLEDEGVDFITLHPRTAREKFRRTARWDFVGALRQNLRVPVAGNGDIRSAAGLLRRAAGDCDAVMVGRLAVTAPWIFAHARAVESGENPAGTPSDLPEVNLEETALRFLELLARHQPPEFHISRARRFFAYFCDNLIWGNYVKNLLGRETALAGMESVLSAYFEEHPEERFTSLQ
ncbi:MAG: tRNA-dihydrouridine synthase family protein [Spirochaetaceae bacterium]|jgi:tRNA-dihydrouridine synthase|nr:tRNA-dihydrouridine synthase family protein [Spirochaetaceae bacterium]